MNHINNFDKFINESKEKWAGDVKVKKNRMHELLNIPVDKKISDVYTSGKKLAEDLYEATGKNLKKTSSMLAFVANTNPDEDIFDVALRHVKTLEK
jgi:hypothetical protein